MRLVESMSGSWCLKELQKILLLVDLKLTALFRPMHTFARLMRLSSFPLLFVPVVLRKALKVHTSESRLEVKAVVVHHLVMTH